MDIREDYVGIACLLEDMEGGLYDCEIEERRRPPSQWISITGCLCKHCKRKRKSYGRTEYDEFYDELPYDEREELRDIKVKVGQKMENEKGSPFKKLAWIGAVGLITYAISSLT